ncbi:MAG: DUF4259 domain-containing protein [Proteobacteria bacterium]|nr:DUF4259 domain-containing protein [Pseudomonadota bacterium]
MNRWGPGVYDNDAALTLVGALLDSDDANRLLLETLTAGAAEAADEETTARVLAAADLAASTRGRPSSDLPDDARELVGLFMIYASDDALEQAREAVRGVRLRRAHAQPEADSETGARIDLLEARLAELCARR